MKGGRENKEGGREEGRKGGGEKAQLYTLVPSACACFSLNFPAAFTKRSK